MATLPTAQATLEHLVSALGVEKHLGYGISVPRCCVCRTLVWPAEDDRREKEIGAFLDSLKQKGANLWCGWVRSEGGGSPDLAWVLQGLG